MSSEVVKEIETCDEGEGISRGSSQSEISDDGEFFDCISNVGTLRLENLESLESLDSSEATIASWKDEEVAAVCSRARDETEVGGHKLSQSSPPPPPPPPSTSSLAGPREGTQPATTDSLTERGHSKSSSIEEAKEDYWIETSYNVPSPSSPYPLFVRENKLSSAPLEISNDDDDDDGGASGGGEGSAMESNKQGRSTEPRQVASPKVFINETACPLFDGKLISDQIPFYPDLSFATSHAEASDGRDLFQSEDFSSVNAAGTSLEPNRPKENTQENPAVPGEKAETSEWALHGNGLVKAGFQELKKLQTIARQAPLIAAMVPPVAHGQHGAPVEESQPSAESEQQQQQQQQHGGWVYHRDGIKKAAKDELRKFGKKLRLRKR